MSTNDTAALFVAAASGLALAVLVFAAIYLVRTLHLLRDAIVDLRNQTLPVVSDVRAVVGTATDELERVDALLGTAESIGGTLDSASRLAYLTFSNPVIKVLAFATGTGRAARRFRRRTGG